MLNFAVVPLVGTWIEILKLYNPYPGVSVVPLVGTWIEILIFISSIKTLLSFPSWERGLKCICGIGMTMHPRRSPRGNVD